MTVKSGCAKNCDYTWSRFNTIEIKQILFDNSEDMI